MALSHTSHAGPPTEHMNARSESYKVMILWIKCWGGGGPLLWPPDFCAEQHQVLYLFYWCRCHPLTLAVSPPREVDEC